MVFNPYQVLGVSPSDDMKTVKKAYLRMCKEHHPDSGGNAETFMLVQKAWKVISEGLPLNNPCGKVYHKSVFNFGVA